ncbi:MAG: hypothetical protein J6A37_16730 [Oscillospiraceae bacterium]|nr:hypothetical protein [Oscillospiraceae bacterium]
MKAKIRRIPRVRELFTDRKRVDYILSLIKDMPLSDCEFENGVCNEDCPEYKNCAARREAVAKKICRSDIESTLDIIRIAEETLIKYDNPALDYDKVKRMFKAYTKEHVIDKE